ncbi:hypothetical protein DVH24_003416 [Malus domestica]|uniref:Uncharacterized protein n=1 Tax=Malus domestica TaxID=3750 RepID=A0A498IH26_MALDO|nr:hypothetical protein DVH24_003416 [Malus domestica]
MIPILYITKTAAKIPTATDPAAENLFKTAPFAGRGASVGELATGDVEGEVVRDDDGGGGGESATGDVEGEVDGEVLDGEGAAAVGGVLKGEGAAAVGGVLDGEGAAGACLGESVGDLAGDDAGDCAPVEASNKAAISTKTTPLNRAICREKKRETQTEIVRERERERSLVRVRGE